MSENSKILFERLKGLSELKSQIYSVKDDSGIIRTSPLIGSSKALLAKLLSDTENQIFILCETVKIVNETKVELDILGLENLTIAVEDLSPDSIQEKLTDLRGRKKFILLAAFDILKLRLPATSDLENRTTRIEIGGKLGYDELVEYFNLINYNRDKFVESPGDFAVRGSLIDFWSYSEKQPCRLEFDGDFLESIRYFDPETQRSLNKTGAVTVAAALDLEGETHTEDILDYLDNPLIIASEQELNDSFRQKEIPAAEEIEDAIEEELKEELYEEAGSGGTVKNLPGEEIRLNDSVTPDSLFRRNARWLLENPIGFEDEKFKLNYSEIPPINSNFGVMFEMLKDYSARGICSIITVENELQKDRLIELFSEYDANFSELMQKGGIRIEVIAIKNGLLSKADKTAILTDYQIFNKPYRTKLPSKFKSKKSRVKDFASIKKGDFVVHENFGIGQYAGLETIKIGSVDQESIKILFAEGGVVYVNLNYLGLVKKFSSADNAPPKLSVLGGSEWKTTKKKVKSKIKEAARELITLYAKRKAAEGFAFSSDSIWQKELEASFFYEDTPDQTKVTSEVKNDMESPNPMDRLVCGDVGFGKTEIAVRAAFKAINDGKQAALLVPTTILAEQHYNTFKDRLSQFPVKVEVLSRFQSKAKQAEIVEKLKDGQVDLVVGTHRLVSKDVEFKDLGLLIIDEEQRFGVMAKEKLRSLKANVDTLTLTATPIPRTLNLSLLGARDLSIIATPPPNRQPIYTKVDTFDIVKVRQWIMHELSRNGQVYFVHDRIGSIDKIAAYIQKHIPEIKIGVAHGQMRPAQLEKVIYEFLNKNYDMLISTKIIESGLDIPNVNTIIVNRADRFGLAELHQLRGRVGRSDRQAYAYFLVPSLNTITKKAVKRLQAIEEYTELGEGFSISMRDLEIRGAGNLLGTEQSGFIDSVGFDLYMKLLDEAVDELKQDEFSDVFKDLPKHQERSEPTIDTYFEIGIPKNFMPDQADRLSFYTALFSMIKLEEVEEIKDEMIDRFGRLPLIVERLIASAVLRYHASYALLERVVIQKNKVALILPKGDREEFYKEKFVLLLEFINKFYKKEVQFVQSNETLKLEMTNKFAQPEDALAFLVKFCKQIEELISK